MILARITLCLTLPQGLTNVSSRPPPELSSGVTLEATVRIAGVGVSVIDASPRELLYLTVGGISLDYLREGQVIRYSETISLSAPRSSQRFPYT